MAEQKVENAISPKSPRVHKVSFGQGSQDGEDSVEKIERLHRKVSRAKSFAYVEGQEGKPVVKNQFEGRSLGVFTSGGDAQGMNAALRAAVRMGIYLGCKVYLIYEVTIAFSLQN